MRNANLEFRKIKSLGFLYEINSNGTILRNIKSKKQIKIKLDMHHSKTGYYVAFVKYKGKPTRVMIHKAVAECWLGECPTNYEVDHIDRNSHNNDYRNLRYVTKSEQMKNRDHSNISKTGSQNLEKARQERAKPVTCIGLGQTLSFSSYAECSRYFAGFYNKPFEHIRYKLKNRRKHIYDFDVIYRNAETGHSNSTE